MLKFGLPAGVVGPSSLVMTPDHASQGRVAATAVRYRTLVEAPAEGKPMEFSAALKGQLRLFFELLGVVVTTGIIVTALLAMILLWRSEDPARRSEVIDILLYAAGVLGLAACVRIILGLGFDLYTAPPIGLIAIAAVVCGLVMAFVQQLRAPALELRASVTAVPSQVATRTGELLGWGGTALVETRLLGLRVIPVVDLHPDVHRERLARGDHPQLDPAMIAMWDVPRCAGLKNHAPQSALSLTGVLLHVRGRATRRTVAQARALREFGASAVLATAPVSDTVRSECDLAGVGLVVLPDTTTSTELAPPEPTLVVPAASSPRAPAHPCSADRRLEEILYAQALDQGLLPAAPQREDAETNMSNSPGAPAVEGQRDRPDQLAT